MNYHSIRFYTLGCKVNQYEASAMAELFSNRGFLVTESDFADIYVVSGCVVTAEAERKTRQFLRRAKRENPDSIVVSVGCYAQLRGREYADVAIGNRLKHRVVDIVEEFLKSRAPLVEVADTFSLRQWDDLYIDDFYGHTRAWVKIQDGCNHFCSYCIVPYTRGREVSRDDKDILEEVNRLVEAGFREIVLTGVNIGRYGYDRGDRDALSFLIEKLSSVRGLKRLRLSSIEPFTITQRLIDVITDSSVVCKHLHIPLQSGDDAVLRRMKRGYTSSFYMDLTDSLRKRCEDFNITTDVIAGFPGETEDAFEHTLSVIRNVQFSKVHVFPFSPRPMTEAYLMEERVDRSVVDGRVSEAIRVSNDVAVLFRRRFIGKSVEILVEKVSDGYVEGWTANYLRGRIDLKDDSFLKGELIISRVTALSENGILILKHRDIRD